MYLLFLIFNLDVIDFLQLLYAALYLAGLCRFVPESLDKLFGVLDLLLLVLEGVDLLLAPDFPLLLVKRVVSRVFFHVPGAECPSPLRQVVEKCSVVRDDDDGAVVSFEFFLEPLK